MSAIDVLVLYNEPQLDASHSDSAAEAGVLEAVEGVEAALHGQGHRVRRLGVGPSPSDVLKQVERALPTQVVFNLCEGLAGVGDCESQIAGLLELLPIAVTGSDSEALALVRNKPRTQWLLKGAGLPTPRFLWLREGESLEPDACRELLGLGPAIVKPAEQDASLGIDQTSVVTKFAELGERAAEIRRRYASVMIEQFIAGREFNAGVVALPEPEPLPLAEIQFGPGVGTWNVLTYQAKWDSGSAADLATAPRCPAVVDQSLGDEIQRLAVAAFRATGCRDYARVDLRVDAQGRPYILEVNGNPDISPSAGLARAVCARGMAYDDFVCRIVEQALQRRSKSSESVAREKQLSASPGQKREPPCTIRTLVAADLDRLLEILRACGNFRSDEVAVGHEVLREALAKASADEYQVYVAEVAGQISGWSCHGRVPMTDATYDLYWIAVDPARQRAGVGRELLRRVGADLQARGARWLLAETSASPAYAHTRQFYGRAGFEILSHVPDYYRKGDGRIIFGRRLETLPA